MYFAMAAALLELIGIVVCHICYQIVSLECTQNLKCFERLKKLRIVGAMTKKTEAEPVVLKQQVTSTNIDLREPLLEDD